MAGREQTLTLVATIVASGIALLDGTTVNVALPAIEDDLGGGLAGQQWVVEAYLLTLGSLLLVGGSQQVAGWSPLEAGFAALPVSAFLFRQASASPPRSSPSGEPSAWRTSGTRRARDRHRPRVRREAWRPVPTRAPCSRCRRPCLPRSAPGTPEKQPRACPESSSGRLTGVRRRDAASSVAVPSTHPRTRSVCVLASRPLPRVIHP